TIPTSADQEDHVSMGMNAALKLRDVVNNVRYITAIEFLVACQATELSDTVISKPGKDLISMVRKHVTHADVDRAHSPDIEKINLLLRNTEFTKYVEKLLCLVVDACRLVEVNS
ncbi:Phenylalanine/histidine ammonia-lyase, partial [mine drainage metagenome]